MGPSRFKLTPIVIAAVSGVVLGFVVYYVLNSAQDMKGQKLIPGIRPPFNQPCIYMSICGAAAGLLTLRSEWKTREREAMLARLAESLDVAFEAGGIDVPIAERPRLPHCVGWSQCANRFSGRVNEIEVTMFDLTTSRGDGDGTTTERSTVILFRGLNFPSFSCLPRIPSTKGLREITAGLTFDPVPGDEAGQRAVTAFTKVYQLSLITLAANEPVASSEAEVREFFVAPRLWTVAQSPHWFIESGDRVFLLAIKSIVPATGREGLWNAAVELCRQLASSVDNEFMPIPAAHGEDAVVTQKRLTEEVGQAGCWGIVGAFASFLLCGALMFGGWFRGGNLDWLPAAFPFLVSGGYFVGYRAGKAISRRRQNRPRKSGATDIPQVLSLGPNNGVVVIALWTASGWFGGCVTSFLVTVNLLDQVFGPNLRVLKNRIFMGIPVVFLVLGLVIGYFHARTRAVRKQKSKMAPADLDLGEPKGTS